MTTSSQINTPCFLIDKCKLDLQVDFLKSSIKQYWDSYRIGYSFKTNNLPWIIRHMNALNLDAEVVSSDEYNLAKKLGYSPERIIFNGPVKGKAEFVEAVENGAIVNIDSWRELHWLLECNGHKIKDSRIGLRVNFCLENYCPCESQNGEIDGRFGFSYEKGLLKAAISFLNDYAIPLAGLHLHCSSKTRSIGIYKAIAQVACDLIKEYSLKLSFIDIGGGYFGGVEGKPQFPDYFSVVKKLFKENGISDDITIIVEPGISLIGFCVSYITSVVDVKETKNSCFAVTDGSRIHVDPLMRKNTYSYYIENNKENKKIQTEGKDILFCGFTCMEGDIFFEEKNCCLTVGDKLVFEKVGAYTMGLSPQFIEFYPAVYVKDENEIQKVREKATAESFLAIGELL